MDKIIINIYVAAVNKRYEVKVPFDMDVEQLMRLLINMIKLDKSIGIIPDEGSRLYKEREHYALPLSDIICECGINNGDTLLFI